MNSITGVSEVYQSLTNATGTVTHDCSVSTVYVHSSVAGNFIPNFTNVPTTDLRSRIITLIIQQGATPYVPISIQIAGVATSIRWIGGSSPVGNANQITIFTFSLIRTGSSWLVLGNFSTYN